MNRIRAIFDMAFVRNALSFDSQQNHEEVIANNSSVDASMQVKCRERWKHLLIGYFVNMIACLVLMKVFESNFYLPDLLTKKHQKHNVMYLWLSSSFMHGYICTMIPVTYCLSEFNVRQVVASASTLNFMSLILCVIGFKQGTRVFVTIGQIISSITFWAMLTAIDVSIVLRYKEIQKNAANVIVVFINALFTLISFTQVNEMWSYQSNIEGIFKRLKEHCVVCLAFTAMFLVLAILNFDEKKPLPERILPPKMDQSMPNCNRKYTFTPGRFLLIQSYAIYYALGQTNTIMFHKIISSVYPDGEKPDLTDLEILLLIACILSLYPTSVLLTKLNRFRTVYFFLHVYIGISILLIVLILFDTSSFLGYFFIYANLGIYSLGYLKYNGLNRLNTSCMMSDQAFSTTILISGNSYGFLFTIVLVLLTSYENTNAGKYGFVCMYLVSCGFAVFTGKKEPSSQYLK